MQIGDIVEIVDWKGARPDTRKCGTVVRLQGNHRWSGKRRVNKNQVLAEVLWQDGQTGWVLSSRLGQLAID